MHEDLLATFGGIGIRDAIAHSDAESAVERTIELYEGATSRLRDAFRHYADSGKLPHEVDAHYPFIGARVQPGDLNLDGRIAYGALHDPGLYGTTVTTPRLFADYFRTQIGLLMHNHRVPVVTGISTRPIPLPFVMEEVTAQLSPEQMNRVQHLFAMPDLSMTDDDIANGTWRFPGLPYAPLALFTAERVDYSLARLGHYTGTHPQYFQRFVLLTNYQRYVDHFIDYGRTEVGSGTEYDRFVEPGDVVTPNPTPLPT